MTEDVSLSRLEARFGDWMERRGVDRERFWACYNLVSAGELLVMIYAEALRPAGLSRDEWRILAILDIVEESEPRRLAETLWLSRSAVVNAVTRLEHRGLVSRQPAANDHRLVLIRLTSAGKEQLEKATGPYVEAINSLEWDFTEEEERMLFRLSRRFWLDNYHRARKTLSSSPRVADATAD